MTINTLSYEHNAPGRCDECVQPQVEMSQIVFASGAEIKLCRRCLDKLAVVGRGGAADSARYICPRCKGEGKLHNLGVLGVGTMTCMTCNGKGTVGSI